MYHFEVYIAISRRFSQVHTPIQRHTVASYPTSTKNAENLQIIATVMVNIVRSCSLAEPSTELICLLVAMLCYRHNDSFTLWNREG